MAGRRTLILGLLLLGASAAIAASEGTLVLRWEAVPGAKEYVLEISEDRDFSRVIVKKRVPNAAYRFKPPSTDVSYYFRVAAVDDVGRLGVFSRAMPIQQVLPAPALVAPASGAVIDHVGSQPTVTLRWKAIDEAVSYRVAIGTDRDLSDAQVRSVKTTALTWSPPELGTFHWRIAAVDKVGLVGRTSPVRSFVVRTGPPRLRQPRSGALVAFEPPATRVALRWTSGPAQRYEIQLATNAEFRKSRQLSSKSPSTALELGEAGTWFRPARATAPAATTGRWSTTSFSLRAAAIALESPAADAALVALEPTLEVSFAWAEVAGAHTYTVTLVSNGEEERIEVREPTATAKLPAASHTWSVAAYDRRRRLLEFSEERSFSVTNQLPAPELEQPAADASFVLVAPGKPEIELIWKPVTGATGYEIEVAASADFAAPERQDSPAARATLWVARPGDSYWRVRAANGEWSEIRKLSIVPRARRAEITADAGGAVVVEVVDESGAGVPGVPLTGAASTGALTPFEDRGDGSYVATWSGDGSATVSATGPFELSASTRVGAADATLIAGAKVGVLTNFGADASPRFQVQAAWRLPWLEQRLFALAALGYAFSGKGFDDVVEVSANLHRFPITLGAGYRHPFALLEAYGTLGIALDPFAGTVDVDGAAFDSESGLVAGVDIAAGAAYDLGPGQVFAELALRATSSWDGLFALGGAAFVVAAGYSMAVF